MTKYYSFSEEAAAAFENAALDKYDFVTCIRENGTYYGNQGAKCNKGTPATKKDLAAEKKKAKAGDKTAQKNVAKMEKSGVVETPKRTTKKSVAKETKPAAEKGSGSEIKPADIDKVDGLQKGVSPLGKKGYDPQKALDQEGNEKLGEGKQGAAFRTKGPPPGVVKKGEIGEDEAKALAKLKGVEGVPELHGQTITGSAKSSTDAVTGHVKTAQGVISMSEVKGKPIAVLNSGDKPMSPTDRMNAMNEYVRIRRDMHLRGVAHNDMHEGNYFYDRKTKTGSIVDFGLAQANPRAALREALGMANPRNDFQAGQMERTLQGGKARDSGRLIKLKMNQERAEREMYRMGFDPNANPGIRTNPKGKDDPWKDMTDEQAFAILNTLYSGV